MITTFPSAAMRTGNFFLIFPTHSEGLGEYSHFSLSKYDKFFFMSFRHQKAYPCKGCQRERRVIVTDYEPTLIATMSKK